MAWLRQVLYVLGATGESGWVLDSGPMASAKGSVLPRWRSGSF